MRHTSIQNSREYPPPPLRATERPLNTNLTVQQQKSRIPGRYSGKHIRRPLNTSSLKSNRNLLSRVGYEKRETSHVGYCSQSFLQPVGSFDFVRKREEGEMTKWAGGKVKLPFVSRSPVPLSPVNSSVPRQINRGGLVLSHHHRHHPTPAP